MPVHEYGQHLIHYAIERVKGSRSLRLVVDPKRGVVARAPLRMAEVDIAAFVRLKAPWLVKHLLANLELNAPEPAQLPSHILYRGESIPLQLLQCAPGEPAEVVLWLDGIHLRIPSERCSSPAVQIDCAQELLKRWYMRRAGQELRPLVKQYSSQLGLPMPLVYIKGQSARWGSCASDGSIRLNWRLIKTPAELQEYVCAHECCHLIEMNHGPRFWALMTRIMPDYPSRRKDLRDSGARYLMA